MSRRVFRSLIPVDGEWHTLDLHGRIVHTATRDPQLVEVWHIDDPTTDPTQRTVRVFGTGEALPVDTGAHVGTATAPGGHLVWHLFEQVTAARDTADAEGGAS